MSAPAVAEAVANPHKWRCTTCLGEFGTPQPRFHCKFDGAHTLMTAGECRVCRREWFIAVAGPLVPTAANHLLAWCSQCQKDVLSGHAHCPTCSGPLARAGVDCPACRPSHHPGSSTWIPTRDTKRGVA